jgi:beta-alanine--pyruvate transaminase
MHGHQGIDTFWLPFTPNRKFKRQPRLFVGAEGMYYIEADGRRVLDGIAGLWCVNAGHAQPAIVEAIAAQARRLDFVSSFTMTHPLAFELSGRLAALAPEGLDRVFFTNSGSEAVDTALKIARAYHRARGESGRVRFIGRARAYHGVGWGGLSVGGIGAHRHQFGPLLADVAHLPHTHDLEHAAFSRGQPEWGGHLAEQLTELIQVYHASTIAAVIVEPMAGAGGVLPPPQGYLERLREICDEHGILLIFDEVITGFGRLGAPFAARKLNVRPDLITCAKGMTNGAVPMGAVIAANSVYDALMRGPEDGIELVHGYTYSAHPLACAAALATLDVYKTQGLFERANALAPVWERVAHGLGSAPNVIDVRNLGIVAAIELAPRSEAVGARGAEVARKCLDEGFLVRALGDTLILSPPLTISEMQIDEVFASLKRALQATV